MPELYLDHANTNVSISQNTWDLCFSSPCGKPYDHNHLLNLAAGLKIAGIAHGKLDVLLVSAHAEALEAFGRKVAEHEGFEIEVVRSAMVGVGQALGRGRYHAVVLAEPTAYEGLRLITRALSDAVAPGGVLYLAGFSDLMRYDASLSRASTIDVLRQEGFAVCSAAYYALFRRNAPDEAFGRPPAVADFALQDRVLFVLGHHRSGSSVLFQIANDQPDVHLTYEANLFLTKNQHDLIANYNANQQRLGRKIGKGFHLPAVAGPNDDINAVNRALLSHYSIVGDKIALGPRQSVWERHPGQAALEWFGAQFPFARYICLLREPTEAVAAMDRMAPDQNPALLLENWVKTALLIFDIVTTFPNQRLMLFENLMERRYQPLALMLGREDLVDRQDIGHKRKTTTRIHVEKYFAKPELAELAPIARALSEWYSRLPELFDPDTGLYVEGVTHDHLDAERKELQSFDEEIAQKLHG